MGYRPYGSSGSYYGDRAFRYAMSHASWVASGSGDDHPNFHKLKIALQIFFGSWLILGTVLYSIGLVLNFVTGMSIVPV